MKSKYKKLSHTVWLCTYHIVFCPKYRYEVITKDIEISIRNYIYKLCGYKDNIEIEEINIQVDHVHMIISISPKYSISEIMGYLKGKISIQLFEKEKEMKKKYWGRHIWSRGYCVSTVGLDRDKIGKYVKWQQKQQQKG